MNNLSSYCGLVDAKIRASHKDLPVLARDQKIVRRNIAAVLDERSLLITKGPVGLNHNETLQPP